MLTTSLLARSQVFQGCQSDVATECQISTSVMTDSISQRGSMVCISISLTAVASMIRVFGRERVVYWREAQALPQPRHTVAYFVGKDLSMFPTVRTTCRAGRNSSLRHRCSHLFFVLFLFFVFVLLPRWFVQMMLAPMFFCVIFLSLTTPRGSFGMYYLLLLSLQWTATSLGYMVSILAPDAMSQLVGVVLVFSSAMFAGGMPTLKVCGNSLVSSFYTAPSPRP